MSLLNSLEFEEINIKNSPNSSSFVFRHLPPQMGITFGNFLRRILKESLSGVGILGVEITDKNGLVETAFTASWIGIDKPIPWYLIAKLKEIIFIKKGIKEEIFTLELSVENKEDKERIIMAGDFTKDNEVEVKNPELELTTLSPGGKLVLKLYCQKKSWLSPKINRRRKKKGIFLSQKEWLQLIPTILLLNK